MFGSDPFSSADPFAASNLFGSTSSQLGGSGLATSQQPAQPSGAPYFPQYPPFPPQNQQLNPAAAAFPATPASQDMTPQTLANPLFPPPLSAYAHGTSQQALSSAPSPVTSSFRGPAQAPPKLAAPATSFPVPPTPPPPPMPQIPQMRPVAASTPPTPPAQLSTVSRGKTEKSLALYVEEFMQGMRVLPPDLAQLDSLQPTLANLNALAKMCAWKRVSVLAAQALAELKEEAAPLTDDYFQMKVWLSQCLLKLDSFSPITAVSVSTACRSNPPAQIRRGPERAECHGRL